MLIYNCKWRRFVIIGALAALLCLEKIQRRLRNK